MENNNLKGYLGSNNSMRGSRIAVKGEPGNGIDKIEKTEVKGKIDVYTITFTNGDTTNFCIENGKSIEANWLGTQLGIRREGDTEFVYVDLKGERGERGEKGDSGESYDDTEIKESLENKADLVNGKVPTSQLPEIEEKEVVISATEPNEDFKVWIDTSEDDIKEEIITNKNLSLLNGFQGELTYSKIQNNIILNISIKSLNLIDVWQTVKIAQLSEKIINSSSNNIISNQSNKHFRVWIDNAGSVWLNTQGSAYEQSDITADAYFYGQVYAFCNWKEKK